MMAGQTDGWTDRRPGVLCWGGVPILVQAGTRFQQGDPGGAPATPRGELLLPRAWFAYCGCQRRNEALPFMSCLLFKWLRRRPHGAGHHGGGGDLASTG